MSTAGYVKLLLPPRQSRGNSHWGLVQELTEARRQQAATSEILRVISSSPTDVQPIFDAIVRSAVSLCGGLFSTAFRFDGELVHLVAHHNFAAEALEHFNRAYPTPPGQATQAAQAILERKVVHTADAQEDIASPAARRQFAKEVGFRSALSVPVLLEGKAIGAISVSRREPLPFSESQIALLQTFADQAVIAIENVRLFDDVQKRTKQLSESLQQQTATADVLKVISRSTFDLQAVFDTLVDSAARLCDAKQAMIWRQDSELYKLAANYGFSREFEEFSRRNPIALPGRWTITGRTVLAGKTVHIPDVLVDSEFTGSEYQIRGGFRTGLGVPLLRGGQPIGVFVLTRPFVKPFTDKQIELVSISPTRR